MEFRVRAHQRPAKSATSRTRHTNVNFATGGLRVESTRHTHKKTKKKMKRNGRRRTRSITLFLTLFFDEKGTVCTGELKIRVPK